MSEPASLTALIEMLEKATGPAYALDCEIEDWRYALLGWGKPLGQRITPPAYTASIDAALTLVPEGDGWHLDTARMADGTVYRCVVGPSMAAWAKTPALALCVAALNAYRIKERLAAEAKEGGQG